ncbi:MAG: Uma2 family endonuclease [Aquificae bacterium]|nr:Uma2 family endonuclease [Aquificota bacterium]
MPTTAERKKIQKPQPYRFTIKDLQKMYEIGLFKPEEKIELINGELVMMAPIGFRHMKTVDKLNKILSSVLADSNYIVSVQNPIKKNEKDLLYPDIAIYPEEIYKKDDIPKIKDAVLIVEVSDTTLEYDKEKKLPIYAKGNAKEVWIVNLKENFLEVYTQPSGKIFKNLKIYKKDEKVKIFDKEINLSEIF